MVAFVDNPNVIEERHWVPRSRTACIGMWHPCHFRQHEVEPRRISVLVNAAAFKVIIMTILLRRHP